MKPLYFDHFDRVAAPGALSEDGSTVIDPSKAERRTVTLGSGDQEYVSVTEGLEEGEVVLVPVQSSAGLGAGSSTVVVAAGG